MADGKPSPSRTGRQKELGFFYLVLLFLTLAGAARANIGMENLGYGAAVVGMGGTGVAAGEDTTVINTNPAGLVRLGDGRADLGLEIMFPDFGLRNAVNDSDGEGPVYFIPAGSFAVRPTRRLLVGLGMFNEGGTGTEYGDLLVDNALMGGSGLESIEHRSRFGFMILAPAAACQIAETLAIGVSPQIGYGTFEMEMPWPQPDLRRFGAAELEGKDFAFRLKVGVLWQLADWLGFGLAYTSAADLDLKGNIRIKTATGDIEGMLSQSLLRGDAEMNIGWPEAYKGGVFLDFRSRGWPLLALEVQRVNWSRYFDGIPVRFKHLTLDGVPQPDQSSTMAVGMEDQTAYRVGIEIPASDRLAVRLGYTYGRNPIPASGLLPVINAIVEHHVTLGIGYRLPKGFILNAAAVWGFENTVRTETPHAVTPDAAGTAVDMGFFSLLIQFSYSW